MTLFIDNHIKLIIKLYNLFLIWFHLFLQLFRWLANSKEETIPLIKDVNLTGPIYCVALNSQGKLLWHSQSSNCAECHLYIYVIFVIYQHSVKLWHMSSKVGIRMELLISLTHQYKSLSGSDRVLRDNYVLVKSAYSSWCVCLFHQLAGIQSSFTIQ